MAITRRLLPEEARKINNERKSAAQRPKYYDPNTGEYITISEDMEAFLILLPTIAKTKVVAWIKVMMELDSVNLLRNELLTKTLDTIDQNALLSDQEFGQVISGFSNMRAVVQADGFETVPDMASLYNALNAGVEELYDFGEYLRYSKASSAVVRSLYAGDASKAQSRMAAASWILPIMSYG
jgi:hypothetical protein